jgi:hypothetical protein
VQLQVVASCYEACCFGFSTICLSELPQGHRRVARTQPVPTKSVPSPLDNLASSVGQRGGARRVPQDPEPTFELYVLGQLFRDFRHAVAYAAVLLAGLRKQLGTFASRRSGLNVALAVGAVTGGYVGTCVAAFVALPIAALVGLLVAGATAVSWGLIWLLRVADRVRRCVRRASYECPTDHERFSLPVYVCPACRAEHHRLVPGRWGILRRECQCGKAALPTTVMKRRQRVPQPCPWDHPMSGFLGFAENVPIALVGGRSSGKSAFLGGALLEIDTPDVGMLLPAPTGSETLAPSDEIFYLSWKA